MRQTRPAALPDLWLLSDKRNDAGLEQALRRLPRGSGFVYRHYHLPPEDRFARFAQLHHLCRARDHCVILADSQLTAREWLADGIYGSPRMLTPKRAGLIAIATAHDMRELAEASRCGADAVMLSPVFTTRSHPDSATLGPMRFRMLARHAQMPVIALGGMTPQSARRLGWQRWAAIDGLSSKCRDS